MEATERAERATIVGLRYVGGVCEPCHRGWHRTLTGADRCAAEQDRAIKRGHGRHAYYDGRLQLLLRGEEGGLFRVWADRALDLPEGVRSGDTVWVG